MSHYNKTTDIVRQILKKEKYKGKDKNGDEVNIKIRDLMFVIQCRAEFAFNKIREGYAYRYPYLGIFKPSGSKTCNREFARTKSKEEWELKEEYDRNKIVMGKIKREQYIKNND